MAARGAMIPAHRWAMNQSITAAKRIAAASRAILTEL